MRDNVLLSIVIANYNYGRFLETAIGSVVSQCAGAVRCPDGVNRLRLDEETYVELIICDAESKDNSVDVIRRHEGELAWWCSEKDGGQSEAFNKGFSHATGRFLTWLNADDIMVDGALRKLHKAVQENPRQEWFAGGSVHFTPELKVILCARTRRFSAYEAAHGQITVYSPSSFFSRLLYERVGKIDESFHYSMDTHLWCKFFLQEHVKFQVLSGYVFGFRYHSESKTTCVHFKQEKSDAEVKRGTEQGDQERAIIRSLFPPYKPMSNLIRLLRTDWIAKALGLLDTLRLKGRSLCDCGFLVEG